MGKISLATLAMRFPVNIHPLKHTNRIRGSLIELCDYWPSDHRNLCRIVPSKGPTKEVPIVEIYPEFYHIGKHLRS